MNKICTSLEQSQKLKELWIDINTADMYWWYLGKSSGKRYYVGTMDDDDFNEKIDVPAWSLSALLDVLPILERKGYQKDKPRLLYNVAINKWIVDSHVYTTDAYDNPVDAAFEMVCWLKENGKI